MSDLLRLTENGIWCKAGSFYIDPMRKVDKAIITHAHGDHARKGMGSYLSSVEGLYPLKHRMGSQAVIQTIPFGKTININGVTVSLHPAGHILGSAQVRVEYKGEVWVFSGDYKLGPDQTCSNFESVKCDTFISECTFGYPNYIWPSQQEIFDDINNWWKENASQNICSIIYAYSLGKAQRVLSGLDNTIGAIYTHTTVQLLNNVYKQAGIKLHETEIPDKNKHTNFGTSMVIAPPALQDSTWLKIFGNYKTAFASGWMLGGSHKVRTHVDRGFALSDHADWPSLHQAVAETGCSRVLFTHGNAESMAGYYKRQGKDAGVLTNPDIPQTEQLELL